MKTAIISLLTLIMSVPALAEARKAPPHLVELFVSQNCPACPAAMAYVAEETSDREDVFVLTWSIEYWNYLGWHDTFAEPAFSDRQKAYADAFELRGPFTPMVVSDAREVTPGNKRAKLTKVLEGMTGREPCLPVHVRKSGEDGRWVAYRAPGDDRALRLTLVQYQPGLTEVTPTSGPNKARNIVHQNVVLAAAELGSLDDEANMVEFDCAGTCALLASDRSTGELSFVVRDVAGAAAR